MAREKIVFIVGPTAVGKSKVALEVASFLPAEIVSCDSMQVYRGLNVASNKPSPEEFKRIPHHLIDIVSVEEEFDVARYNSLALEAIFQIHSRRKLPLVVGGSGMYMQILLDGIFQGPGKDEELRRDLKSRAQQQGVESLYQELEKLDPVAASKIHPQDTRRMVRALEVCYLTKQPISEMQKNRSGVWEKCDVKVFGINCARENLYHRIDNRVEDMFQRGIVEEIRAVQNQKLTSTARALIGVKEVQGYLAGEYNLDQAKYLMKLNTRHLAKRQLTWFRREKRIQWFEMGLQDSAATLAQKIVKEI
ncbi:MAG: tRNA (adenosine(37)-N6)-dimethylallyltransferase MiaA [Candidatus Omnitrophica bacterium]|nr:tRNA (adenosine(37)-N6)-dimethylallyltransferase MiaA [Candidatus Omnitrophota bacterium]